MFGPERMAEMLVWLRMVGADDKDFFTVKPAAAPYSRRGTDALDPGWAK